MKQSMKYRKKSFGKKRNNRNKTRRNRKMRGG